MANWTLAKIVSSGLCSGCGACTNATDDGSISMRIDSRGYLRPSTKYTVAVSRLVQEAVANNSISLSVFKFLNLAEIQPYQLRRKRELSARLMAAKVKAFLGTTKRLLAGAM